MHDASPGLTQKIQKTVSLLKVLVHEDSGVQCKGDHAKMVHGSGSAYCATFKISQATIALSSSSPSSDQSVIDADVNQESIMKLEDMQFKSGNLIDEGQVFWDTGSSRVLIRNKFARRMNFRSQEMSYLLTVVGGSEVMKGVIYEMKILDNHGIVHKTRQGFCNGSYHR